jgi:hypothetical protein
MVVSAEDWIVLVELGWLDVRAGMVGECCAAEKSMWSSTLKDWNEIVNR